jgi:hypothetical protein
MSGLPRQQATVIARSTHAQACLDRGAQALDHPAGRAVLDLGTEMLETCCTCLDWKAHPHQ